MWPDFHAFVDFKNLSVCPKSTNFNGGHSINQLAWYLSSRWSKHWTSFTKTFTIYGSTSIEAWKLWNCSHCTAGQWAQNRISGFGPTTQTTSTVVLLAQFWGLNWPRSNFKFSNHHQDAMAYWNPTLLMWFFSVKSLSITGARVILCIELKQSHCHTVKFCCQYLQYLQKILPLEDAMSLLETVNISPVCKYIMEIWPAPEKTRSACSILGLWQDIYISFGPNGLFNGAMLGSLWWSTLHSASHSY